MTEREEASTQARRGGAARIAILLAGGLLALGVVLYFVVASGAFFQRVVLPRVGAALDADVTVADAVISPFSSVSLANLEVRPRGGDPVLTAREVRVRYSLWSIFGGRLVVTEAVVASPVVTVTENADGKSNIDAIVGARGAEAEPAAPDAAGSSFPPVDVKRFALEDATVRFVAYDEGGGRDVTEVSGLDLAVRDLAPGSSGTIEFTGALAVEDAAQPSAPAGSFRAKFSGRLAFDLLPDMQPASLHGNAAFSVEEAAGALAELKGLASTLDGEITPTEVERVALQFTRAGAKLGEVRVSGPYSLARREGRLRAEILALDRQVLNLVAAGSGMDFGTTTVDARTDVELTKGGRAMALRGRLDIARFQVTRLAETTPTLDSHCDFDVLVDEAERSVSIEAFELVATQNAEPLVAVGLDEPLVVAWGESGSAVGDATLDLALTGLNLADWRAFTGDAASAGELSGKAKVTSTSGGDRLALELDGRVNGLSATLGEARLDRVDARLQARGSAVGMKQFALVDSRVELAKRGQPALVMSGSGTFDGATRDADLQVVVRATLARLLPLLPQSDVTAAAGVLDFTGRVARRADRRTVTGQLTLSEFTGSSGELRFEDYGAVLSCDAIVQGDRIEVRRVTGDVRVGQKSGGHVDASGTYETAQGSGELSVKLTDFDPNGLRPFLESALGDRTLVSVALNTTAAANVDANGDGSIQADLQVTDLVVRDPSGTLPTTPLEARVRLDASVASHVTRIRRGQLTLTPTDRARNELNLTGSVDASSDAISGNLELASDSLDITPYYELFAGEAAPAAAPSGAPRAAPAPTAASPEPPAADLPFGELVLAANVGRFSFREVAITNLASTARIDGSRVVLDPVSLSLDGAPVRARADLDLGVPGYEYDVTFDGTGVPLEPLVASFLPERAGQFHGAATARFEIRGAGVTGPSLRRNLAGRLDFASSDLGLEIGDVRNPLLDAVIRVVGTLPALLTNPTGALGDLLVDLSGLRTRSSFLEELTARPIDAILVRGQIANGRFDVARAEAKSQAFEVAGTGEIKLADVLADSAVRLPVQVWLSRPLAARVGLAGGTPVDQRMVALPEFVKMKGSLANPKADLDELAVVALAARAGGGGIAGQIGGAAGKASSVLDAVGDLLGRKTVPPPAGAETDPSSAPGTGAAPAPSLLDLFKKPKRAKESQN